MYLWKASTLNQLNVLVLLKDVNLRYFCIYTVVFLGTVAMHTSGPAQAGFGSV